jgi:HK97 family phage prohead protease
VTAPAAPAPVDAKTQAVIDAVTVALLAGATVADVKALLAGLEGMTTALLAKVAAARQFDGYISTAISEAAAALPPVVDTSKAPAKQDATAPADAAPTSTPVPSPPKAKATTPTKQAGGEGNHAGTAVPQSIQDQVNAALAKKGKARPKPKGTPAPSVLIKQAAPEREAASKAAYLANASTRMGAALSTGDDDTIAAANAAEDRYLAQHQDAVKARARAVAAVAKAVAKRKPDANGEVLLGWNAHVSDTTCARCLLADGRNFNALVPPPIGYPGEVHLHDHCLPGPPHDTTDRVEDVDPGVRVSKLQFGKGSKLWKYWTGAKGFKRYGGALHPWTTLKAALISEGVPVHAAGGLATNIMMATAAGRALFAKGHKGKRAVMTIETRSVKVTEVRAPSEENPDVVPGFTARAVNYNVPDTYRTSWQQGVFKDALEERLPSVVWNHDWADPVGRVTGYRDGSDGLDIDVDFDDFEAVPRAKQAHAQMKSGTMNQFSFAFVRGDEVEDPNHRGVMLQTRAGLQEFSIVLNGSVPGTHSTSVRSAATVDGKRAADLITKLAAGDIELVDALTELRSTAGPAEPRPQFEFRALTDNTSDGTDPSTVLSGVTDALASLAGALDISDVEAARQWFNQGASLLSELQYLLGMVPGLQGATSSYAWRTARPTEKRTDVAGQPTQAMLDETAELMAKLDGLGTRSAPRFSSRAVPAFVKAAYQTDTKAHAVAAWAYINKPATAKSYSAADLAKAKATIKAALKKFGVDAAA